MKDVQTERTFDETVANKLSTLTNNELPNSQLNEYFVETINQVAENTLPKQVNQKLRQPWHDDDKLRELYAQKDHLRNSNAESVNEGEF